MPEVYFHPQGQASTVQPASHRQRKRPNLAVSSCLTYFEMPPDILRAGHRHRPSENKPCRCQRQCRDGAFACKTATCYVASTPHIMRPPSPQQEECSTCSACKGNASVPAARWQMPAGIRMQEGCRLDLGKTHRDRTHVCSNTRAHEQEEEGGEERRGGCCCHDDFKHTHTHTRARAHTHTHIAHAMLTCKFNLDLHECTLGRLDFLLRSHSVCREPAARDRGTRTMHIDL